MKLLVLGVGDAFSDRHYSAAFAVEHEGVWLLVDCPHPIRKMGAEAAAKAGIAFEAGLVDGLVLTHLHADHASGVEGLGFFQHFATGGRVPLLAAPEVLASLWSSHLAAGMGALIRSPGEAPTPCSVDDFFDLRPLAPAGELGPFRIELFPTTHHIPTFAVRIHAGDCAIGYSADAAYDPALIAWLAEADLVIHEANVGPAHTPIERLTALPAALRGRLRVIGFPDFVDVEGAGLSPLSEGELIEVAPHVPDA